MGRTAIEFSGTVGQLEETFQTSIHRFNVVGKEHLANVTEPQIPAALAPIIGGVAELNDYKPVPNLVKGFSARWNSKTHRFIPDMTGTVSGTPYLFVGPGDAATIYNTPNSLNTTLASGQPTYDGTGITIGIAGNTQLDFSTDINYRNFFGLSVMNSATIVYDGNQDDFDASADQTEAIADIEISGALAPGAKITYYTAPDTIFESGLILAIYRAINDNDVNILNVSFGACEAALGAAGNLQILNAWEQAAAQGIAVTVSSGDSGSAGCDNPNLLSVASHGLAVNGLASTPYNIAVGGTDFDVLRQNFSTYVGANATNFTSALTYIPENPWNDSTISNGSLSGNVPSKDSSGQTNIWAAGGGMSSSINGQAGYQKPGWQQGFPPSNADAVRDVPDVSVLAGAGRYGAVWALCAVGDCNSGNASTIHGVGGTSASSAAFAGILALVNQKAGASTRLGQPNWVLYNLAQTTPSVFHPITTGNISVDCVSGTLNCQPNNFLSGYNTQPNYSLATGLGSIDAGLLVNHWSDDSLASTTTTLSLDRSAFQHGTPVTITAGVNPSSATGDIAITDNYSSQVQANGGTATNLLTLSGGSATDVFSQFPGGSYNVYARYGGDGNYAGSVSQPVAVTVTPEGSTLQLMASYVNSSGQRADASGTTLPLGTVITMNAIPVGSSQSASAHPITDATGTVTYSDTASGYAISWNQQARLDSSGTAEINTASLPAGAHSIVASYSGDLSYNPSNVGPVTFTIGKVPTAISIGSSASTTILEPVTVTAQITASTPASSLEATGAVIFTDTTNNTVLGTTGTDTGCSGTYTTMCVRGFIDVPSTKLVAGANTIVATYSGDSNFAGSGPSVPVVVTCNASCWNPSGQSLELAFYNLPTGSIAAGGSVNATVGVLPFGGFTGDVNLTCIVSGKNPNDQHIPTCSFNPTKVTIAGDQAASSTLTISTTAPVTSSSLRPKNPSQSIAAGGLIALVVLLGPGLHFRRRYRGILLGLLLTVGGISGCGGGHGSSVSGTGGGGGNPIGGTTPDVYTVTFHAADAVTGTVTAQDYFNVTVN